MLRALSKLLFVLLVVAGAWYVGRRVLERIDEEGADPGASRVARAVPVEVAPVERGPIALRRTFSGALEAHSRMQVASKVGGRVERIGVGIGDSVRRGQVVVWIDDDELEQAVAQAQAELEVAEANASEAESALEIAERELARIESLQSRGVTSESQFDAAKAGQLAKQARLAVTRAQITRSEAELETMRIRLAYSQVTASWSGAEEERLVAERFVDEGDTIGANGALLSIVSLDPVKAVIFAPERDYAKLRAGQLVTITTQAFPGERFEGEIERIAPVFRESTRQARVELEIPNGDLRLKPGMFVRATIELAAIEDALIVPEAALTERSNTTGVFVLAADETTVRWQPLTVGVREGGRVQVEAEGLSGLVVVLGQQLVDDGSAVIVKDAGPGEPEQ